MLLATQKLVHELLSLWLLAGVSSQTSPETEVWAGHQISFGERKIPFRGKVRTRTDTYLLARVRKHADRLELVQQACRVEFAPVGGVQVSVRGHRLQPNSMDFFQDDNGSSYQGSSRVSWQSQDVDQDGHPGMTVSVNAPVCSGDLYVSNDSSTKARAQFTKKGFQGIANVAIHQQVLGADGVCLSVVAKDVKEKVRGPFAYVPVDPQEDCRSLLRKGWPVKAD